MFTSSEISDSLSLLFSNILKNISLVNDSFHINYSNFSVNFEFNCNTSDIVSFSSLLIVLRHFSDYYSSIALGSIFTPGLMVLER